MAQIYAMVRLLPAEHPYLLSENMGKFGVRHVIAAAANNLVFSRNNIDQIIVFGLLLLGVVLLALQIIILALSFILGAAFVEAAPLTAAYGVNPDIFLTLDPTDDIAFMLLDRVFGVPDFFGSCVSDGSVCAGASAASGPFPWPFHLALHQLFRFYSMGMLVVGVLIFVYFIIVIIAETATSGTPFGQRFQNVWVPIRLVLAVGLLIPLPITYPSGGETSAYSSAQYIVFAAAKYGSSLATNAWIRYNKAVFGHAEFATVGPEPSQANPLGEKSTLLALPKQVDVAPIVEALSLIHTCAFTHFYVNKDIIKVKDGTGVTATKLDLPETTSKIETYREHNKIKAFLLKTPAGWMPAAPKALELKNDTTYQKALEFFHRGDIIISFGFVKDGVITNAGPDNFTAFCGEIRIPVTDPRDSDDGLGAYAPLGTAPFLGAVAVQQEYFNTVRDLWGSNALSENYIDFAGRFTLLNIGTDVEIISPCEMGCKGALAPNSNLPQECDDATGKLRACHKNMISAAWKQNAIENLQTNFEPRLVNIWKDYNDRGGEFAMDTDILDRGWGGAGIWFNRIAGVSGNWSTAVNSPPTLSRLPHIMEKVREMRIGDSGQLGNIESFNPSGDPDKAAAIKTELEAIEAESTRRATILYSAYDYWRGDQLNFDREDKAITGALETAMNAIFGTYGLFSMVENTQTHPLAQLSTLGRGLVEASIRNVAISTGASAMGGVVSALNGQAGALVSAAGSFFNSVAFIGLTAGLVLYYIVPFLPFLYFFFAVASWIKTIFEAMVGVPLWALAHLRLDGDGLSGDSAQNGYFLILEVFLRPILTVFGLLAAMAIFTAQVRILNITWQLVTENSGGYSNNARIPVAVGIVELKRSIVDQFFFTITYAIVVYMMATAAFKLVDTIPDNILRWIGSGASSFGDINQDQTGELTRYAALGGMTAGREAAAGVQQLGQGIGGATGKLANMGRGLGGVSPPGG
jgi:conjugal transfer/type IV secretion protein DotA/TraY